MNSMEKAKNTVLTVKKRSLKKVLAAICSASMAMSAVAVNAFAEESVGSTSMYQTLANSFSTGAQAMGDGIAIILGAIIPIGVGIIGMYSAIGAGKKILAKLSS